MPEQDKKHSDIESSASTTVAAVPFAASGHASGRLARFRLLNAAIAKTVHQGKPAYRYRKKPYTADNGKIIIGGVQ
jgi:hypothetical protein